MPTLVVNDRELALTNLDREFWPDDGLLKHDLIRYYIEAAPYLLPHLRNRPLVVQRFPEGIGAPGFYQKNIPEGAPEWLRSCPVRHGGGKLTYYLVADSLETLVWLGNQACLELHPWLSSVGSLENPDFIVFDLDPMEQSTFSHVCTAALAIKELLARLRLQCYPKLSGASGMQIYLPVQPRYSYRQAREFAQEICRRVHQAYPEITTLERKVEQRGGKLYLDYLQNGRGKTLAAPYSPRPLPGAPVSLPLTWEEVSREAVFPGEFTITNVIPRLQKMGDLFAPVLENKQQLPSL
ncbi:MAG TPA: non-homologous end-joining DNA ligase [Bacillota bacterium]|jgi:bifunctional non-homologous end joining protein LigD|nr:non-homologous end-joining DNA ligase [Bacillota bacterium]